MSQICVDTLLLHDKSLKEKNNCITIQSTLNSVTSIKNSLGHQLKNSRDIRESFIKIESNLSSIEESLAKVSAFMSYSALQYEEWERKNILLVTQLIDGDQHDQNYSSDFDTNNHQDYEEISDKIYVNANYTTSDGETGFAAGYRERHRADVDKYGLNGDLTMQEFVLGYEHDEKSVEGYVLRTDGHLESETYELDAGLKFLTGEAEGMVFGGFNSNYGEEGNNFEEGFGIKAEASISVIEAELAYTNKDYSTTHSYDLDVLKANAELEAAFKPAGLDFGVDVGVTGVEIEGTLIEFDLFGVNIELIVAGSAGSVGGEFDLGVDFASGQFNIGAKLEALLGFGLELKLDWSKYIN